MQGRTVVLAFAAILAVSAGIVVAYKIQAANEPPVVMRFAPGGAQGNANATSGNATALPYKPVHDAYFLQDHLDTAVQKGYSEERDRLRCDAMRDTLQRLTGSAGPVWNVTWNGVPVTVSFTQG